MGLGGVTVVLSGMSDATTATDMNGQYAFTGLRSGTYSVEISGFDGDEVGFGSLMSSATVGVGESKVISFDGTYLRTAGIMGQVSAEGVGLAGVTVSLAGEGEESTTTTDAGGLYAFSKLKAGAYSVAISGYDPDEVEFASTSMNVSVALGETANIPFEGTLLRTSGISGRVSVEGMGLDGVEVTLAGAAEATAMTSGGGQYAFAGLAEGTYVVSMMNPNETAYAFETMSATIELGDAESNITNFDGTHTRTASVSGVAYIDEAPADGMYTANEPMLPHAGIPVALQGPGVNDVMLTITDSTGAYMFSNLMAGSYRALVNMTPEVAAAITAAGFAYKGELTGAVVNVDAGGSASVHLPFGITMQTIAVGARMGYGEHLGVPVAGVELAVYANANMTGMLGEGTTNEMGHATIDFARAMNTGPGGNDNLVFVNVKASGHDDLSVSDNDVIEVSYPATARAHVAPAAVTLVNTRANFQYWVKNNADARGGDMGLGGWKTDIYMGEVTDESMPLMVVNAKGDTVNATMPTDTAMASRGRAGLSYSIDPAMLKDGPATFSVMVQDDQSDEMYEQSDALVHMHNALAHPAMNTMAMNDLGPIYVTWTTQTLTVGVYREVDDEPGFTDYRAPMGGDQRPVEAVADEMAVQLLTRDTRNRLRAYEYDHDGKASTDDISSMAIGKTGMASFPHLPADEEFTVRLHVRSDRMLVGETDSGDMETFGDDLDIGMSTGSFGEASGGGPEVKLCSVSTDAKKCATWGYQWTTGSVSGSVAGPGGASVSLTAETDADDRGTKTSTKAATLRKFSISDIQDGEYALTTPNTADNSFGPKGGFSLEIYHDEDEDDKDDDTEYVGTAWSMTNANFTATNLRQSIKGFVANDGGDGRARGNESMSDVEVNLLKIAKAGDVSKNKKDTTFTIAATVTTNEDGFYEFNNLAEGGKYFVEVPAGDDYMGLRDIEDGLNNKSAQVRPDEYPAMKEPFDLPSWNHMTNEAADATPTVRAPAPSTVSATLQNFALVYTDNNVSGSVTNLSGSDDGDITVELAHCEAYSTSDGCEWGDIVKMETNSKGSYEFADLMEGYYEVWFTGGGLAAANVDDKGKADDDGDTSGATSHTTSVMGRDDYSTGNNFIIYSERAGTADILTSLVVMEVDADGEETDHAKGVAIPSQSSDGQDAVDLGGPEIDWASVGVAIETKRSAGASVSVGLTKAVSGHSASDLPFNVTGSGENQSLATEITVTVTAANGYNDHDYSFSVSRANPVGNSLAAGDFDVEDPADAQVAHAFGKVDRFTVNVAEAATDMTFTVTLEDIEKQDLVVEIGGKKQAPESREDDDDDNELRYEVELSTGANTIDMMVTSEDGEDREHQLVVRRDARSDDATLKALSLSAGTLSPAFNAGTTSYTASVGNAVRTVRVTATANDADASVTQSPTNPVALSVGANPITVTVTAEDGTTGSYTVRVTRDPPGVSSDATLGALSLSEGALSPAFDPAMLAYTASVGNGVSSVMVTATANHSSASVAQDPVNPVTLAVGATEIEVTVTAEDATTTMTYTVTVTRDAVGTSSDANLGALSLSAGTLSPAFDMATTSYTASVGNDVTSVTVTATASHSSASVAQEPDNPVDLVAGVAKTITLTVTAGDGSTKPYTVTVTRAAGGVGSSDADLSDLSLSRGSLTPTFDAATTSYTASVGNTVEEVTVTATKSDADASVAQSPVNPVTLSVGANPITVTVTAEDGTTKAYTVTVTRAAAPTTPGLIVSVEEVTVMEGTERDYTVRLTTRPSGDVTVNIATAEAHDDNPDNAAVSHITTTRTTLTFTETNWNRAKTVAIAVAEDNNETTEIANLNHTAVGYTADTAFVKVTATDNDVVAGAAIRVDRTSVELTEDDEDDGSAMVMVRLAVEPTGDVTVAVTSEGGGATVTAGASLTFTDANWDDEQPITVTAATDDDPADAKATVTISASGGGYGSAEDVEVDITVEDDEEATISVTDDFHDAEVVEGGTLTYMISLSAPPVENETVRVNLQVLGGLATVQPAQAVFMSNTSGNAVEITVSTLHDSNDDDATFTIRHSVDADDDSGYEGAAPPSNIDVTVKDDEAAGVVVSHTSLSVEEGGTAEYTIRLTKAPSNGETVTIHLAGTGVNLSAGSLTFTEGNGTTTQTVTVTGHTDSNSVDDQAMVVHTVVAAGGDKDYETVTASTVRITVTEPSS